jgi:hypothetical protein
MTPQKNAVERLVGAAPLIPQIDPTGSSLPHKMAVSIAKVTSQRSASSDGLSNKHFAPLCGERARGTNFYSANPALSYKICIFTRSRRFADS